MKEIINYSQCWEDPMLLSKAFEINSQDVILSITSGGDNTLALLCECPQKIISVDSNPIQKYLLELKLAAIKELEYHEFLEFLGVKKSLHRNIFLKKIENSWSAEAKTWWRGHESLIEKGVIHIGRFEHFLNSFRRYILPLIHSRKTTMEFLNSPTIEIQRNFYKSKWNSKRWRLFFRLISSRYVLRRFARQQGMFDYVEMSEVGKEYFKRMESHFNTVPFAGNHFINYCLSGNYGNTLPIYLQEKYLSRIKENSSRLISVQSRLEDYLKITPNNFFTKFNLSDIFETLSLEQNESLWREIIRTGTDRAKVVYWNNLVSRSFPLQFSMNVKNEEKITEDLHPKDRVFFYYGGFHVNTIIK